MSVLNYGELTTQISELSERNFVHTPMDVRSLCTTPIELLSNDGSVSIINHATGFFWIERGQGYLVTNWHVVSGRNPFNGDLLDKKTGYIPQSLSFFGTKIEFDNGRFAISRPKNTIGLDSQILSRIEQPPSIAGGPIDLCALPIPNASVARIDSARQGSDDAGKLTSYVNEAGSQKILTQAGDSCVILGYPIRNYSGGMTPVWKQGYVASDTGLGLDGRPMFLIDAATTPGMSGSPIFRRVNTFSADNRKIGATQAFYQMSFIGVYAGRLQSSTLESTNLGYAWYQVLIPDVIAQSPVFPHSD